MAVLKSTNVRSTWRACAHSGRTATLSYSMSAARTSSGLRSASAMPSAHMRTLRTTKTQSTGPLLPPCAPQESLSHAHSLMFGSGTVKRRSGCPDYPPRVRPAGYTAGGTRKCGVAHGGSCFDCEPDQYYYHHDGPWVLARHAIMSYYYRRRHWARTRRSCALCCALC